MYSKSGCRLVQPYEHPSRIVQHDGGFTLLELMTVVTIIGILTTLAMPNYELSVKKARETALKQTLFVLRDVIDQYRADQGKYPKTLTDLTAAGYVRVLPTDPLTRSNTTWQEIPDSVESGISDVHSGSPLVSMLDGRPYNEW